MHRQHTFPRYHSLPPNVLRDLEMYLEAQMTQAYTLWFKAVAPVRSPAFIPETLGTLGTVLHQNGWMANDESWMFSYNINMLSFTITSMSWYHRLMSRTIIAIAHIGCSLSARTNHVHIDSYCILKLMSSVVSSSEAFITPKIVPMLVSRRTSEATIWLMLFRKTAYATNSVHKHR